MDIDATFLPVADTLINSVFPTAIVYYRDQGATYDPAAGEVTPNVQQYNVNAGVLSRARVETGGTSETYEIAMWVEHKTLPFTPKTGDKVEYDGTTWKVTTIDPTYSSKALIASKLTLRNH